jgi:putative flippase GtrA
MKRHSSTARALVLALLLVFVGGVAGTAPAQAASFTNSYYGNDSYTWSGSTTLRYSSGHAAFNVQIGADAGAGGRSVANWKYTIRMYNSYGTQVWAAYSQGYRTYWIGSNVTRIVVTPNSGYVGVQVNWWRV